MRPGASVRVLKWKTKREPVQWTIGPVIEDCSPPVPDLLCPINFWAGFKKRLGPILPVAHPGALSDLRRVSRAWCEKWLTPLTVVPTFEEWLVDRPYSGQRKKEITSALERHTARDETFLKRGKQVRTFVKAEVLEKMNAPRLINPICDEVKAVMGPLIHAIEDELFSTPFFIKHIAEIDRPAFLLARFSLNPGYINGTDYTSWESQMIPDVMRNCECVLYDYMVQNLPYEYQAAMKLYEQLLVGDFVMYFHDSATAKTHGIRKSGDLPTSCGNGFTNLMACETCCERHKVTLIGALHRICVEGDDGLCETSQPLQAEWFAELGLKIKIEHYTYVWEASFCKLIFEPGSLLAIRDPCPVILKIGWSHCQYAKISRHWKGLLRAKALSLINELPGCPIINVLADRLLQLTQGAEAIYDPRDTYHRRYEELIPIISDDRVRQLFAQTYGVSIPMQLTIEQHFRNSDIAHMFEHPAVRIMICRTDNYVNWVRYHSMYVEHK